MLEELKHYIGCSARSHSLVYTHMTENSQVGTSNNIVHAGDGCKLPSYCFDQKTLAHDGKVREWRRTSLSQLSTASTAVQAAHKQNLSCRNRLVKLQNELLQLKLRADGSEEWQWANERCLKKLEDAILQVAEAKV